MKTQNKQEINKLLNTYDRFEAAYKKSALKYGQSEYKNILFQNTSNQHLLQNFLKSSNSISISKQTPQKRKNLFSPSFSARNQRHNHSVTLKSNCNYQNFAQLHDFMSKLYVAKCKDLKVQRNNKQQNIFIERMQSLITNKKIICVQNGFRCHSMSVIANFVKTQTNLLILILDKNCLGDESIIILANVIAQSSLIKLSLVSTNISYKGCRYLIQKLQNTIHLTDLNISSSQGLHRNKLGTEGVKPFEYILKNLPTLHCLDVSGSNITQEGFGSICKGLQRTSYLYSLDVAKNQIKQQAFLKFGNKLTYCKLVRLNLAKNFIRDQGIMFLGELLGRDYHRNPISDNLKYLNLKQNGISSIGLQYFCKLMNKNFGLQQLILDNNPLYKGNRFQCIKGFLRLARSINKLSLKKINIEPDDFQHLSQGMNYNISVVELDISENHLQRSSLKQISYFLKTNKTLKIINLNNCNINDEYISQLVQCLNYNHHIQQIFLEGNFIKDSGAKLIERLLYKNKQLIKVKLEKNLLSIKKSKDVKNSLQNNRIESIYFAPNIIAYNIKQQQNKKRKNNLINEIEQLKKVIQEKTRRSLQDDILYTNYLIEQTEKKIKKQQAQIKLIYLTQKTFLTVNNN